MRESEIRLLRRSDLTDEGIHLLRSKTGAQSLITWTPALRQAIDAAFASVKHASVWVFPSRSGGPYTDDGFRTIWHRLRRSAKVEGLQFRDLRRSAASDAESLEAARALLGHASSAITRRVYFVTERVKPVR